MANLKRDTVHLKAEVERSGAEMITVVGLNLIDDQIQVTI
jgi:hypothetical protein